MHDDLSEDELRQVIAHHRDARWADLIVLAIGLAAETHPEEIKHALECVFDLSAVNEAARRTTEQVRQLGLVVADLRHKIQDLEKAHEDLQREIA